MKPALLYLLLKYAKDNWWILLCIALLFFNFYVIKTLAKSLSRAEILKAIILSLVVSLSDLTIDVDNISDPYNVAGHYLGVVIGGLSQFLGCIYVLKFEYLSKFYLRFLTLISFLYFWMSFVGLSSHDGLGILSSLIASLLIAIRIFILFVAASALIKYCYINYFKYPGDKNTN